MDNQPLFYKQDADPISELTTRLVVSAPAGHGDYRGLFLLDFRANTYCRLNDSDCRGLVYLGDDFLVAAANVIIRYNREFEEVGRYNAAALDLHGICLSDDGYVLVAETAHNRVGIYDPATLRRIDEIRVSDDLYDRNHINDITVSGDSLLVSMFTLEGEWAEKQVENKWEGCIAEYSLSTKQMVKVLRGGLQLPHSILREPAGMYYCESLALSVFRDDCPVLVLTGYTRGLAKLGPYLLVGQSRMRHWERYNRPHASLDAGVHIVDMEKRLSRFIQLPAQQVYSILVLDDY